MARPVKPDDAYAPLAARAACGDAGAFDRLIKRLTPGLSRVLTRRTGGNQTVVDELLQDTWAGLWEALAGGRYDPQRAAVSTFAYAIAHKLWLRHLRRTRGGVAGDSLTLDFAADDLATGDNHHESLELSEEIDAMRGCLSAADTRYALSDEERAVVRGLADGETERSLASQLEIAASTVHARKLSAYGKLRRCLALKGIRWDSRERGPDAPE